MKKHDNKTEQKLPSKKSEEQAKPWATFYDKVFNKDVPQKLEVAIETFRIGPLRAFLKPSKDNKTR